MIDAVAPAGKLAENLLHFARVLRAAGVPVGPAQVADALVAVQLVGVERRDDWYVALAALFLTRHEQRPLFDQAFHVFWRAPDLLGQAQRLLLPQIAGRLPRTRELSPRLAHAFAPNGLEQPAVGAPAEQQEFDAVLEFSARERLQSRDFEQMTPAEWEVAQRCAGRLALPLRPVITRRWRPGQPGAVDMRQTLRASLRCAGEPVLLRHRRQIRRTPPLVALCDISGSMHRYTRVLLHFLHALGQQQKLSVFLFGTRLSNITRCLRARDVDDAMRAVSRAVPDWSGGTRIGPCLEQFNRAWARRVLTQRAAVLLVTDGLDRAEPGVLQAAMQHLRLASRQILWLNPLLRYDGFEPKAAGIRVMLPLVDRHLPAHNLDSLAQLAQVLRGA
ncbi:VWA domain-containing protein [Pandoraea sp.]|uniref:vWA domain-containing protein n=1 Tax=Pandoraea sp. TaxID=1883445 RepID=UPI0025EF3F78|nr:VWA domain-containing protein [Pandoraea sp.]